MSVSIRACRKIWRRQRLLAGILVLSLLPSIMFLGHWDEIFGASSAVPVPASALFDLSAEHAEQVEHAQHCHTNLAGCSAQPMPAGVGLFATREQSLGPAPSVFISRPPADATAFSAPAVQPPVPPPRPGRFG